MAAPTVQAQAIPTYTELLAQQKSSRLAFGRMLLNLRRRNGWSQYTAFTWAEAIGELKLVISYGNLSVIEQGKAGELRQRAFWQLWELNRRIADRDWGRFGDGELRQKLEAAIPLGDAECPVWGPLEFWACYGGLRPVLEDFAVSPAPVIGPRQATLLSNRWRQQLRSLIESHNLDPATALAALMQLAGEEHRKGFYAVLTGFRAYSPHELSGLWLHSDRYRPEQWLEQWRRSLAEHATTEPATAA
ncbi:MAG: hypothetical protein ACKO6F_10215 [Cyanobium sp.]